MRNIIPTTVAIIKDNLRSRTTIFFIIFFPLLLGIIFSLITVTPQPRITVYVQGDNATQIASYLNSRKLFIGIVGGNPSLVRLNQQVMFLNTTSKEIYYNQLESNYVPVLQAYMSSFPHKDSLKAEQLITKNTPVAYELSGIIGVLALATLMFSGLGTIVFGVSPKDKIAISNTVATVMVFPLMFVSNAFFYPTDFPTFFRPFVNYQPVSIVNDIIRDLLIYNEIPNPLYFVVIIVLTSSFYSYRK